MRTLYLLRHAEAAPSSGDDLGRPLTANGRIEAETVGRWFQSRKIAPALTIHSPALRVRETFAGLKKIMPGLAGRELPELYNAPPGQLYEAIKGAEAEPLLLIAHNPGIHALAVFLTGGGEQSVLSDLTLGFAPATLAAFDCPVESWAALMPSANRLAEFFATGRV
jgi:phosphohistidine phosphatase